MAGEYTPEEYQQVLDAYNDALIKGMDQNSAAFKQLKENLDDANKGIRNYAYQMRQAGQQLGSSMLNLGKQMASGAQGAAVFNDSLTSGANLAAKALERFGPWGQALGLATKALGAYVGAVNKQSDALYKSYQEISRTGAIGAGGMSEVYQNLKKFGYGIDELGNMGALLAENGKNLALFGGSVSRGTRQIADLAQGVKDSDLQRQFMNLGLSVDAQNQMIAGYAIQQGRLGKSTDLTTKGMAAYVREQEILTRLTGQSAKEMQDQMEAQLQNDDFMAGIMDMPKQAQDEARKAINMFNAMDPSGKLARGFAASVNGLGYTTEEGAQMFAASNGKIQESALALAHGQLKAVDLVQQYGDAVGKNIDTQKNLSKIGANYMGPLSTSLRVVQFTSKGVAKVFDETGRAVDATAAGLDGATNSATGLRQAQMKTRDSWENFIQHGVEPVTTWMSRLANVVEYLYRLLPGSSSILDAEREQQRLEAEKAQLDKDIVARKQQLDSVAAKEAELEQAKKEGKPAEVIAAKEAELKQAKTILAANSADLAKATAALAEQQNEKVKESEKELEQIKRAKLEAEKDARVRLSMAKTLEEKAKVEQESAKIAQELLEKEKKAKAALTTAETEKSKLEDQAGRDRLQRQRNFAIGNVATTGPIGTDKTRSSAEQYLGRKISDKELDMLVRATHAESGAKSDPKEQAMIMGSILNRAREKGNQEGSIQAVLEAKNQFQSVTGTKFEPGPSKNYTAGPQGNRAKTIESAAGLLDLVPKTQRDFTAASSAAYGKGTNIGYRDTMLAQGGQIYGGSVFRTQMKDPAAVVAANLPTNSQIPGSADGNVLSGPRSGYQAMLHGTEAVVPLPDGRTIPVTIAGLAEQNDRLATVLQSIESKLSGSSLANSAGELSQALITKLDDLIRVASDQLGVSSKILKAQA
jgi:hypothetical protein